MTLRTVGYASYLGIHALVQDLPEDFLARIESGLDGKTKERLALGLRAIRIMRRASLVVLPTFVVGAIFVVVGFLGGGILGILLLALGGTSWLLTVMGLLFEGLIYIVYRKDIRGTLAFARAMRGSSLARDLA